MLNRFALQLERIKIFIGKNSRALLLLVVAVIGENHHAVKVFGNSDQFLLSLVDLDPNIIFELFVVLEVLFHFFLLLAFVRRYYVLSLIGCTVAITAICFIDFVSRAQFVWLGTLLPIALLTEKIIERFDLKRRFIDLPVSSLLVSIYGFGCYHKIANFQTARRYTGTQLWSRSDILNKYICSDLSCAPIVVFSWAGALIDGALMWLMLRRDHLRYRLAVSLVYHYTIAVTLKLLLISFPILSLHFYVAIQQSPETAGRLFKNRNYRFWFSSAALILALQIYFQVNDKEVLRQFFKTTFWLLPFAFLFVPFIMEDIKIETQMSRIKATVQFMTSNRTLLTSFIGYLLILFFFGISPLLLKVPYSLANIGWSMFSGQSRYEYQLVLPDTKCFRVYRSKPFMHILMSEMTEGKVVYFATDPVFFERLERYLKERKKCLPEDQKLVWTLGIDPINPR